MNPAEVLELPVGLIEAMAEVMRAEARAQRRRARKRG
jgi:hypothetical protein